MPRVKFTSPFNWIAHPREHFQYPAGFEGAVPEAAAVAAKAAGVLAPDPKEVREKPSSDSRQLPSERRFIEDKDGGN